VQADPSRKGVGAPAGLASPGTDDRTQHGEVDRALRDLGVDPDGKLYLGGSTRELATIWWAVSHG